jgi:type I restriction enzyme, S subunit
VSTEKFEKLTRSKVESGDILIAKIGSTYGLACLYPPNAPTALIPANMCKITCDNTVALTQYTLLGLQSTVFKSHLDRIVSFSAQPAFNVGNFKSLPIPLPPLIEQTEIVRRVETLFAFADRLEARLQTAKTATERLTPALLAKAFRGELVPQDPNDEPASELLRRLQQEALSTNAKRGRKSAA